MFKRFSLKAVIGLGAGAAVAIGLSVAAYAYFTAPGAGTGTAVVGSASSVQLAGTITGTLYPAGAPASVSVLVTNAGTGSQYVTTVHLASIAINTASSTYTSATSPQQTTWNGCVVTEATTGTATAFTMADVTVNTDLTKAGTGGATTTVTGSLQMNDTNVSQNNCEGAPLLLNFTSS
jgi:hypothetical protein